MYTLQSVKNAVEQPRLAVAEVNRFYNQGPRFRSIPANQDRGIDIINEDWDTLIILDACRFDVFNDVFSDTTGELKKVESKASATGQFLRANFADRELHDTVYVTANPQLYRVQDGTDGAKPINVQFHDQIEVWKDNWHEEHGTVMPKEVTEAALDAAEKYPHKRHIIHFLQPHAPYVGTTGIEELPTEYTSFWGAFRKGKINVSLETAKEAYRENVELALPHVSRLLSEIEGKTVVTADHGELLGERDSPIPIRRFGHPAHTSHPKLIDVPWLVHERGSRPHIVSERPDRECGDRSVDSDLVSDRLQALGYT